MGVEIFEIREADGSARCLHNPGYCLSVMGISSAFFRAHAEQRHRQIFLALCSDSVAMKGVYDIVTFHPELMNHCFSRRHLSDLHIGRAMSMAYAVIGANNPVRIAKIRKEKSNVLE